jgi:hypothetical protein
MKRIRRVHFGPDREHPFVTLCGAGQMSLSAWGRARWRSVKISHNQDSVDCPRCKRLLKSNVDK